MNPIWHGNDFKPNLSPSCLLYIYGKIILHKDTALGVEFESPKELFVRGIRGWLGLHVILTCKQCQTRTDGEVILGSFCDSVVYPVIECPVKEHLPCIALLVISNVIVYEALDSLCVALNDLC